jgi:hypothetical protein
MDGIDVWHAGLPGSDMVAVRAGRHVDETSPALKRSAYKDEPTVGLAPDFDGPWPGWGAFSGDEQTNGAWFCLSPSSSS